MVKPPHLSYDQIETIKTNLSKLNLDINNYMKNNPIERYHGFNHGSILPKNTPVYNLVNYLHPK